MYSIPEPPAPVRQEAPREPAVSRLEVYTALLFLAVFGFLAFRWGIEGALHSRKVQIVPDMKGKSIPAALDMVSPLGFSLRKDRAEFDNSVPIGAILRQTPSAGTKAREGKIIRVVVSQGGETVFVPNLAGLPLRNAEMLLRQSQLLLGEVSESYSLKMDKGMVLSQSPKSETSVERNAPVNLVISGGQPPEGVILMPDFLRKNVSEAQSWAGEAGVQVVVAKDPNSLFPYGMILEQDPAPDAVLSQGGKVRLTVSGRAKSDAGVTAQRSFRYEVPQGGTDNHVRILIVDQYGERELFNGLRPPGSKVDLEVPQHEVGQARMKVYLNGILVEERDL